MTRKRTSDEANDDFVTAVGRVLLKSARLARRVARKYGTLIYIWEKWKGRS
jgi:hypothetical protein